MDKGPDGLPPLPGENPETGVIYDDPGLDMHQGSMPDDLASELYGSKSGSGDPAPSDNPFSPPQTDYTGYGDPEHGDSFVAEHPDLFGGTNENQQN